MTTQADSNVALPSLSVDSPYRETFLIDQRFEAVTHRAPLYVTICAEIDIDSLDSFASGPQKLRDCLSRIGILQAQPHVMFVIMASFIAKRGKGFLETGFPTIIMTSRLLTRPCLKCFCYRLENLKWRHCRIQEILM